ncbi:MAG: hypothetical protein KJ593_07350 [Candidatus Omnitrophica bacterium]|nr:hypothetical protein [Candidatus Omnitrophota bacterium]
MSQIPNLRRMSTKDINSALNAVRRRMNSPAAIKSVRRVRDYEEYRDFTDEKQRMEEEQQKTEEHPDYQIEISEEKVEAIICELDDDV